MTGRDPGAAGHVQALWQDLCRAGWDAVHVAASGQALRMLAGAGVPAEPFAATDGTEAVAPGGNAEPLLNAARALLDRVRPEVVLTVLSSGGAGVDEAVAAAAACPVFCLQDYWGDVNLQLGVPAGLYLALDEYAVDLTRLRFGLPAVAVGSPKHAAYAGLDVQGLRRAARARWPAARRRARGARRCRRPARREWRTAGRFPRGRTAPSRARCWRPAPPCCCRR